MKATITEAIFLSIPKSFTDGEQEQTAWIEDARRCPVHDRLREQNRVVVTFRFFGESPGAGTPASRTLDRRIEDGEVVYVRGERTAATMSLNIYAKKGIDIEGAAAVDAYLDTALIPWILRDLPVALATVSSTTTGRSCIDDLTDLEDGLERRHLDVFLEVPTTYRESPGSTIDTVAVTVDVATDPAATTVRIAIPPQSDIVLRDVPVLLAIQGPAWSRMFSAIGDGYRKLAVRDAFSLTDLPVEITAWDAAAGTALVWVRVPTIAATGITHLTLTYDPTREDNTAYVGTVAEPAEHPVWETAIGLWPWIALTHWVEPDPAPECLHPGAT